MKGTEMAKQRLTRENIKEMKTILKRMQEENPDLEYWFLLPRGETKSNTVKIIIITKGIKEKLYSSKGKLDLIFDFDGHVLIDGALGRHLARKWKLRI